jgi:predicted amino acid racemase
VFLKSTLRQNPDLIRLAVNLHRDGQIGPNTYVIDRDAVGANSRHLAETARRHGLSLYFMSKQINRNPELVRTIAAEIPRAVAVDWDEATVLAAAGVRLGNVGHLVQPPARVLDALADLAPEVVTVFSVAKARAIGEAAARRGRVQPVLLRVAEAGDASYPGQYGGFQLADLRGVVPELLNLPGIRVAGVTSFPCLAFDAETQRAAPTANLWALLQARDVLRQEFGLQGLQLNAPSLTSCATIPYLASMEVTHGEPGHALTGTTPLHAVTEQPEVPAAVYISEVSHLYGGKAYCFGGGLYPRSRVQAALVGHDPDRLWQVPAEPLPADAIDYYGTLVPAADQPVAVGDTVVYAFRMQAFTARSSLAVVSGGHLVGLYDQVNRPVGDLVPDGRRPS